MEGASNNSGLGSLSSCQAIVAIEDVSEGTGE